MPMAIDLSLPRYTIDDLAQFPDDGNRYELIDGVLFVTPGPGLPHQLVAFTLARRLAEYADRHPGMVALGPGTVELPPRTHLEPDILVAQRGRARLAEWSDLTPHWLAVEVLSRSTGEYDRRYKVRTYLRLGVREVWLVDPWAQVVQRFTDPDDISPPAVARGSLEWQPIADAPALELDLDALFAVVGHAGDPEDPDPA